MTPRPETDLDGVLLVDKPPGWTSHDVVARLRRLAGQRRVGHTGTLDPMATGLLVVCLGRATRLVEYLVGHDKRYVGTILLGTRTTTDDAEGPVIEKQPVPELSGADLGRLADAFTGPLLQRPPAFSAVRVGGERAYAAARRGRPLDLPPRQITIFDLRLATAGTGLIEAHVHCSAGTYIRSLARDLGEAVGCGAHLAALRRTAVGPATVDRAFTLDELGALAGVGRLAEAVTAPDDALLHMDAVVIDEASATRLAQGNTLHLDARGPAELVRVYGEDGSFLAVANVDAEGAMRPAKVFTRV